MPDRKKPSDDETLAALRGWSRGATRREFLRRTGLAAGGAAVAGVIAACTAPSTTGPATATQAASQTPTIVKGGHLTYGNISDLNNLLPEQRASPNSEFLVQSMMFDALIGVNAKGDLIPLVADGLATFSPDGLTATIKVKRNVTWSDGKPLTAQDVVFSYTLDIDPSYDAWNSPSRQTNKNLLLKVQALDDYTVQFTAKQIDQRFALVGDRLIAPKHVLGTLTAAELNTTAFRQAPTVGSGPFLFDHWDKGSQIVLKANPTYYRGTPNIANWVFKIIAAGQNQVNLLRTGEVDYGGITLTDYDQLKTIDTIDLQAFDGHTGVDVILMNLDPAKPPFKIFGDKNVRQALLYAIDREAALKVVYGGHGIVPNAIVLAGSWAYNASIAAQYKYDKAKAEAMLDTAGWKKNASGIREKNGVPMSWEMRGQNFPQFVNLAQICQEQWKAIGCDVTVKLATPQQTTDELLNQRNFGMLMINFAPDVLVPDIRVYVHSKNAIVGAINGASIKIPQLDTLMDQAAATVDRAKAKALHDQVQSLMADEMPLLPMLSVDPIWAVNKRVRNTQLSIYTAGSRGLPWINEVWVADGK